VWAPPSLVEWASFAQKSWRIERPSTPWCGVGWCSLATATARPKNGKTVRVLFWSCLSLAHQHCHTLELVCNGSPTPLPLHCISCALGIACELQHTLLPVSRTCFHGGGEPAPSGPASVAFAINAHKLLVSHPLTHSLTHSLTHIDHCSVVVGALLLPLFSPSPRLAPQASSLSRLTGTRRRCAMTKEGRWTR
jgi:hypothetical protein